MPGHEGFMDHDPKDVYDGIAPYYHLLFDDWDRAVEREGDRLGSALSKKGVRVILDATCGTGLQCIGLAQRGFSVTGSDSSQGMIRQARVNARRAGVSVEFVIADLLDLPSLFAGKFDAVISCGNSLSHIQASRELLYAFRSMHTALCHGGWCLVDASSYEAIFRDKPAGIYNRALTVSGKKVLMYDTRSYGQCTVTSTFNLLRETEQGWQSDQFVMELRAWKTEELLEALTAAGFVDEETTVSGDYVQVVSRKP